MLYLVDSVHTRDTSFIQEFHRHEDGTKEIKVIENFKHYFFCDERCPIDKCEGVVGTVPGFVSIEGNKLKKVILHNILVSKSIKERIEKMGCKHYEADVPFNNRYTVDNAVFGEGKLKVCWLDIETDHDEGKMPDIETANKTITCLSTKIGDEVVTWLCGDNRVKDVRYFPKEVDMLNDFMKYIYKESPDLISGWNVEDFDLTYIVNRCKRLDIDYTLLSPTKTVTERTYGTKTFINVKGVIILDLLTAYKLWRKYGNLPLLKSFSLDNVAKVVLNKEKIKHSHSHHWMWLNDADELIEYNKWDVELLSLIDARCKIVEFFDNLRKKCYCQFTDVYQTTALIDGYLIKRLDKKIILPTATRHIVEKFDGAHVVDPTPGLFLNVMCEDIKAMYPSIIKTFNISYETFGGTDIVLPTGQTFAKKKGLIPMFLDELADERTGFKKKLKEATNIYSKDPTEYNLGQKELWHQRQFATKIIMNSMYGYLGYAGSRLYKKEVAEAVTGMGKYLLLKIIDWVTDYGCEVIYGDTDSVYVKSNQTDKYQIVMEGMKLRDMINKKLEEFSLTITDNNTLEIEFEKALKKILFTQAKKRYAYFLLWEDGKNFDVDDKLHIQGFDAKRSDNSNLSKEAQLKVLQMIMNDGKKSDVVSYLKTLYNKMVKGDYEDTYIGFPKGISKELYEYYPPGPVIKGAAYSNMHFGTNYGKGSKPKFVWVTGIKGYPDIINMMMRTKDGDAIEKEYKLESAVFDEVINENFIIDWVKMSDSTFKKKLENIFNAIGWCWEPLNNTSLFAFVNKK